MLSTTKQEALVETLLLLSGDAAPTERHFKAAGAAFGVSSRTARRLIREMFDLPSGTDIGLSAQSALDSLDGLDPRVVYATEPAGPGWWPDMTVLTTLAASPSLFTAHEILLAEGRPVPSYGQFCRRLKECLDPAYYAGIARGGGPRATAMHEVYVTRARVPRMRVVELDAFELPIDVLAPRCTRPTKPWLLLAIDRGSRGVVAWLTLAGRPTAADARTLLALMAVGATCTDGTVMGGLPHFVMPDNGGEFGGREFTTALTTLGIDRLLVPASTPHLKGTVERVGQYVQTRLIDTLPGATHGPEIRHGEMPWRSVPLMKLAELEARLDAWFTDYNSHHRHSALRGYTPLQAWLADSEPVRQLSDAHVLRNLMPRVTRTVSKKGVLLDETQYIHPTLGAHIGDVVSVGWLPRLVEQVEVFDLAGEHLCTALDSKGLSDSEINDIMTGRLRRGRAVSAASRASIDLRARLAEQDAPTGPLPLTVTDYLDTDDATAEGDGSASAGATGGPSGTATDLLVDFVLGDDA